MGWFSDLADIGKDAVKAEANRRVSQAGRAGATPLTSLHIEPQNQTVADFERLALTPYRNGQITAAQAAAKIQELDQAFSVYCQTLLYPRALAGAADVHTLALQLIRDLQPAIPGNIPGTGGGGVTLPPLTPGGAPVTINYTTIAVVGIGAYLLLSKKKIL
jgi:hypothetical protein